MQAIGGRIVAAMNAAGEHAVAIAVDEIGGLKLSLAEAAAEIAYGARLRGYRFDKYRTREKPEQKPTLKRFTVMLDDPSAAKRAYEPMEKIGDGVFMTRDLVSEPANVIFPESLAEETKKLSALGVDVEVLGEKQMKKLGMGALLGVGQGSSRESQLVVMQWRGADSKQRPVAFIGKGVTFDSGGLSIKPAAGMEDMKWDMAGSGVVIGLMHALAARKAKVNAVGIVGLVENMPSGSAQRPGDIVTSMSGQTIEVLNTDAEGRLVLADALWYCQENFKPQFMVDLATLTGAIMVALGTVHAGLFCNNDTLSERLTDAGKATGELLWRMPMARRLRQADQYRRRRHEEHRRPLWRCDHGGAVPEALRQGHALGASGYRRRDMVRQGCADHAQGGDGLRRAPAGAPGRRSLRGEIAGKLESTVTNGAFAAQAPYGSVAKIRRAGRQSAPMASRLTLI